MKTTLQGRHGILYPMLVIAAIAAIIFGVFGVAALAGFFPPAQTNAAQTNQ